MECVGKEISGNVRLASRELMDRNKNSVLKQGGILAAAGVGVRIIGMLYRSPLTAIIGDLGNGYYQYAYSLYTIALLVSSYSIPSAFSKILAQRLARKDYVNAQKTLHYTLGFVLVTGLLATLLLFFFGPVLIADPAALPVLYLFFPTIILSAILGVIRGYFQAHRTMVQTSISQLLEQIFNAVFSVLMAWVFIHLFSDGSKQSSAQYGAMGSAFGTGVGVCAGLLFMLVAYRMNLPYLRKRLRQDHHKEENNSLLILHSIAVVVLPFIASTVISYLAPFVNQKIFNSVMVGGRGMTNERATELYGILSGKAIVISNIPIAMANAMSAAMIPSISSFFACGKKEEASKLASQVTRVTMTIGIPCAAFLAILAKPITMILYPQRSSLDQASILLAALSVTVVFYSLSAVSSGILQSIGRTNTPWINSAVGLMLQTLFLLAVLYQTKLTTMAVVFAMILYSFLMCLLNHFFVKRSLKMKRDVKRTYLFPLLSSVLMSLAGYGAYLASCKGLQMFLPSFYFVNLLATALAVFICLLVYAFFMVRFKALTEEEMYHLPKGRKIVSLLKKVRIL